MSFSVWIIEQDPQYRAFLAERNKGFSVFKANPEKPSQRADGSYRVDRTLVMAEERKGILWLGVMLSDDSHFWIDYPEHDFKQLLLDTVETGYNLKLGSARDWFPEWLVDHAEHAMRLEFCSSHVGGFVRLSCDCGESVMIDED